MSPRVCECGCGKPLTPKRWHKYGEPRFLPGHHTRLAATEGRPPRQGYAPKPEEIPSGICECGCGKQTPIAKRTDRKAGRFKGHPTRFIAGHGKTTKRGSKHGHWKGGRITNRGYVLIYMPDDPRSDSKGYYPEHRLVWENTHRRRLKPGEHVHHINGIPDDNRPENLVRLTKAAHTAMHSLWKERSLDAPMRAKMSAGGKKGAARRWSKH